MTTNEDQESEGFALRLPRRLGRYLAEEAHNEGVGFQEWVISLLSSYITEQLVRLEGTGVSQGTGAHLRAYPNAEQRTGQDRPGVAGDVPVVLGSGPLERLLRKLVLDISQRIGRSVEAKRLPSGGRGFSLSAGKQFSWAYIRPRKGFVELHAYKKFAVKAGVKGDEERPTSIYGQPGCVWFLQETDDEHSEHYRQVVEALSEVCNVRQQLGH